MSGGMSALGQKRTSAGALQMSAFVGKADIAITVGPSIMCRARRLVLTEPYTCV